MGGAARGPHRGRAGRGGWRSRAPNQGAMRLPGLDPGLGASLLSECRPSGERAVLRVGAAGRVSGDHVIIDGYNVLYAHPFYGPLARTDLDAARSRLVADLAGFAQGGPRTVVVFDGGGNPASDGTPHHLGSLTVIFSPAGTTADTVIEGLAARFRERGDRAVVVTSDSATRDTVLSGTVSVLSSSRFVRDLADDAADGIETVRPRGSGMPLARRIAPDVSEALARWSRGAAPAH